MFKINLNIKGNGEISQIISVSHFILHRQIFIEILEKQVLQPQKNSCFALLKCNTILFLSICNNCN